MGGVERGGGIVEEMGAHPGWAQGREGEEESGLLDSNLKLVNFKQLLS